MTAKRKSITPDHIPAIIDPATPVRSSGDRTLLQWFDGDLSRLTVGASIGESSDQGANDRWPVYEDGTRVGTLYDDASGLTYDARDDEGEPIF